MPYLDKLRFWRAPEAEADPQIADAGSARLERMVAKQKLPPQGASMEARLAAMESEYCKPLYDSSVYLSTEPGEAEA